MPTAASSSAALARAACLEMRSCARICSAICQPTRYTGFSEVIGSWKIMEIPVPRIWRIWSLLSVMRSWPL
jgi:hypothetical protein